VLLLTAWNVGAATFTNYQVIRTFGFTNDMAKGPTTLIQSSDGALYGLVSSGGAENYGAVFKSGKDGTGFALLHGFRNAVDDGRYPISLVEASADHVLYGLTGLGGASNGGTIFKVNRDGGGYALLHSFTPNGTDIEWMLQASLIVGSDGALYGTTYDGGGHNRGAVFKLNRDGAGFAVLYSFNDSGGDGQYPKGLTEGTNGVLYGTTSGGGSSSRGTIFKLNKDGTEYSVLHNFSNTGTTGSYPDTPVMEGTDGVLYGTTASGGAFGSGTVFKLNKDGTAPAPLHDFNPAIGDGWSGSGLIEAADNMLYGVTFYGSGSYFGTVFRLNRNGTGYAVVHALTRSDGSGPSAILQGADGLLYGAATLSGASEDGTLFRLNTDGGGFAVIYDFSKTGGDGCNPTGAMVEGSDGLLYGTTRKGGTFRGGTVFKLNKDGSGYGLLHSFRAAAGEGRHPYAEVIQGSDGLLYGTTYGEDLDYGTVFRLNKDGNGFAVLHTFNGSDGQYPNATVLEGPGSLLYGATTQGGTNNKGSLFKLRSDGTGFSVLWHFSGSDGEGPYAALVKGSTGGLYGTTCYGGTYGWGTVFKLSTNGTGFVVLHSFSGGDGRCPQAALLEGSDGVLYGTTSLGASGNRGTLFKLDQDGTGFAVLHTFSDSGDGYWPYGALVEGNDGMLYGTANGGGALLGALFRMNKDGTGYAVLYRFGDTVNDGQYPYAGLAKGSDGALYGTTFVGGSPVYSGVVFRLGADSPTLHIESFQKQQAGLWRIRGRGMSGKTNTIQAASSVSLNDWKTVGTAISSRPDGSWEFDDTTAAAARFYRAAW